MRIAITALKRLPFRSWSSVSTVRVLAVVGMGVALGMLALAGLVLLDARADAWRQAKEASLNLARALEQDIARNLLSFDLSLQGTAGALHLPGLDQATPQVRYMALFDRAATAEYLGSILVLDPDGAVVASSRTLGRAPINVADRDYFRIHRDQPDAGLFISRPYQSRLRSGDPSIAISRRLTGADGRFEGVIMGALRLAFFQDLFGKLNLGSEGLVALVRTDGVVVARLPGGERQPERDVGDTDTFRRMASGRDGQFVGHSPIDGVERLYTFRRVGDFPLLLTVGLSTADIHAAWWRKMERLGSILVLLCGATIALCLLFQREMLRRLAAESALTSAAERLAVMAATDSLTGLANRRQFDAVLAKEWRRAIRNGTSFSLLLVDADCFKAYNDLYGHQQGDEVLRRIAGCIRAALLRPADTGARYGGEEFAVLLPDTDMLGAWNIAERIRCALEARKMPHDGSPSGWVTASIGMATAQPQIGQEPAVLVEEADRALYEAKRGGRNRVCILGGTARKVA
ncbi:GGDEF domain-containing protein [Muricoccus vinaceus]|uniref:diguanylate cyclase n=1 Tax=Muricoccus vinaceus TaxID=424704 RepID=A0ABV6IX19_9PROT